MSIFNWFKKKKKVEEGLNRRNPAGYYGNSNNVSPITDWSDNSTITSHDYGNFGGGESNGGGAGGGWGDLMEEINMKKLLIIFILISMIGCTESIDKDMELKLNSNYIVWSEDSRWIKYYCDSFTIEKNCIKFKGFDNGIICGKFSIIEMKPCNHNK